MKTPLKNIIIRNITDKQREAIEIAKRETGYATASQAVITATCSFSRMVRLTRQLQEENLRLKREIRTMKKCVAQVLETAERISSVMSGTEGATEMPMILPLDGEIPDDPSAV